MCECIIDSVNVSLIVWKCNGISSGSLCVYGLKRVYFHFDRQACRVSVLLKSAVWMSIDVCLNYIHISLNCIWFWMWSNRRDIYKYYGSNYTCVSVYYVQRNFFFRLLDAICIFMNNVIPKYLLLMCAPKITELMTRKLLLAWISKRVIVIIANVSESGQSWWYNKFFASSALHSIFWNVK